MVIGVPAIPFIKAGQKAALPGDGIQSVVSVLLPGHRLAERSAQSLQDRCLEQERLRRLQEPVKYLFHEVAGQVAVITLKALKHDRFIVPRQQGQGGHLHSGSPAARPVNQPGHVLIGQVDIPLPVKQFCLCFVKTQVPGRQFRHLAGEPKARCRQGRFGAAHYDRTHSFRGMAHQEQEGIVNEGFFDEVVIVQDESEIEGYGA